MTTKLKIRDSVKQKILEDIIEPTYISDMNFSIKSRVCWRFTGKIFETLSKLLVVCGTILSFSAGYYDNKTLSFLSGSTTTLSLAVLQFSSFSHKESKKQTSTINLILEKIGIDIIPISNNQVESLDQEIEKK